MTTTIDLLRQRFGEACQERDAILAETAPLRGERDGILSEAAELAATTNPLDEQIKALEAPLFDLNNEIATISRALQGKTAA